MDPERREKHRKRSKGKEKALPRDLPTARPAARPQDIPLPASPEAGSSKLPRQSEWEHFPIAQNEISRVSPVWSRDGRFYFMAAGGSVQVHSTKRLSNIVAHTKPITAMLLHPSNPLHIVTSSLDGTIRIYDWVEGRHVKTIHLSGPVLQLVAGRLDRWYLFCTIDSGSSKQRHQKPNGEAKSKRQQAVLRVDLAGRSSKIGKLSSTPSSLIISPSSTYLVALAANKAYAYRLFKDTKAKVASVKFVSDQNFTCGAFSPGGGKEEWFATGDVKGVIRLWHGLQDAFRQLDAEGPEVDGQKDKRLPTTSLHWHAHSVSALAFTPSGAQLLSVGEESVLVQWHLNSGKKEFIPRLGGRPIISLAVKPASRGNEEEWWMAFSDGSVTRIGANSGSINPVGQGVKLDPLRPTTDAPYPLAIQPGQGYLVVPSSHPSTLQFIDPSSSSVAYDLEVAPSNRLARRDDKELIPVAVEHIAFTNQWMATVEGRQGDEAEGGGDVRTLKVWRYDGRYQLNTQLPRPHGSEPITSIAFAEHLLTCSSNEAKLWSVRQAKRSEHGKQSQKKSVDLFWSIRSTFSYRSMPIHASAFSPDGTIVALVHGAVITLWDVQSNVMLRVLDAGREVTKCLFVGDRHLVAGGEGVVVWDLLSCEVLWSTSEPINHLIPRGTSFTTIRSAERRSTINTYSPSSPSPTTATIAFPLLSVLALPTTEEYIGVAPSGEIFRFGPRVTSSAPTTKSITTTQSKSSSIWQEMFGRDAFLDELAPPAPTVVLPPTLANPTDVFDGPSHTLPPVSLLFDAFVTQLLKPSTAATVKAEDTAQAGGILYEEEGREEAKPEKKQGVARTKKVTDEDVKELETFFRLVLSDSPAQEAQPAPKLANGDGPSKAAVSTPNQKNKAKSKDQVNGSGAKKGKEVAAGTPQSEESREKKHSKKRKAPKE